MPGGTVSDVSRTSPAFSPKIARSSFSSGVSCVSPFGVILPTRISPGFTFAPIRTIPESSRSFRASSETFGISLVTSSLPSLVSRAWISNSSMWIEVKRSSFTSRSLTRIASSKLYPPHGMNAIGGDVLHHAGPLGHDHGARVAGHHVLHAGADQRRLRLQQRHRLALHVGAHEGAVGVVVLEERDEGRRHRYELLGRHVHVVQL